MLFLAVSVPKILILIEGSYSFDDQKLMLIIDNPVLYFTVTALIDINESVIIM